MRITYTYKHICASWPLSLKKCVHLVWIYQASPLGQACSRGMSIQTNLCCACKYIGICKINYKAYKLVTPVL